MTRLLGIDGYNPRDFLAALGLMSLLPSACLHWDLNVPIIDIDELPTKLLSERIQELCRSPAFTLADNIRGPLELFADAAASCRDISDPIVKSVALDLLAAYTDDPDRKDDGSLGDNSFHNANGGSHMHQLAFARELAKSCDALSLDQALLSQNPGRWQVNPCRFRWSPDEFVPQAAAPQGPHCLVNGKYVPKTVPGLNLLAAIGLARLPKVTERKGNGRNVGMPDGRNFTWILWPSPLKAAEASCLLALPPQAALKRQWIIMSSERFNYAKGMYFGPAKRKS